MLPQEGSVKDGRIIVYLERTGPSGGGSSSGGAIDPGAAAEEASAQSGAEAGSSSAQGVDSAEPTKSGEASGTAPKAAGKTSPKGSAAVPRERLAKPTLRKLLPSSAAAAAKNQAATMIAAAKAGAPFCADCAEHQRLLEEQSRR